ncbi:MAG TPA: hypothetical protein VHG91_09025 [Longimicrobium sp.]|nr:hypothetical protein [Longimicrobium sp.]
MVDPFGVPGDPMEEVLSLQTYMEESVTGADDTTLYCPGHTSTCIVTSTCPVTPTQQKPSTS